MKQAFSLIILSIILSGCVTTPEQKFNKAMQMASKTNFEDRPALYQRLLKQGYLEQAAYDTWMEGWHDQKRQMDIESQKRRAAMKRQQAEYTKWLNSLTPAQKREMQLREQEIQLRQAQLQMDAQNLQQQRRLATANALQNMAGNMQRQQEVNAYNARTQVMSQPQQINVNHSGNININHGGGSRFPSVQPYYDRYGY